MMENKDELSENKNGNKNKPYSKTNIKKFSKRKSEIVSDVIIKRNQLLVKFFKLVDLPVKILGDENNPDMIYNDEVVLNASVNNFELNFTDAPNSKNVIYTVKLSVNPRFDKNRILKCISDYKARAIFKVALKITPKLYLTGYNFLNKSDRLGRYPVFSSYNPKIFFTEERAKEIASELNNDGYESVYE